MLQKYLRRILINRWVASIHDLLWVVMTVFLAFFFRFNLQELPEPYFAAFVRFSLLCLPVYAIFFWSFGLYRGLWRFASLPDLVRICKAVALGFCVVTLAAVLLFRVKDVPRTVFVLAPLLLTVALCGSRLLYRLLKDHRLKLRRQEGRRCLVVGAGRAADLLIRDLLSRQEYQPVVLVDDDRRKQGKELHGVRIAGPLADISKLIEPFAVELVIFAIPSVSRDTARRTLAQANAAGVEFKTLPSIHEQQDEAVAAAQLRPLTLDDLLGREPVGLDEMAISSYLRDKTVLVTGSGGSIGSELCRQVAAQGPKRLILFDHGEYNIYAIDHELRDAFPGLDIITVLGDVKNKERVDWVFRTFRPHAIFHAAAYKHVPMVELNPAEGVNNNVSGTRLVAEAADLYGAECFVMVSTDKAVNPANVMGATKRIAEIFCQNLAGRSQTRFITTRFGNVLGSAGSVVPLFQQQIEAGGPLTVTHRDITRFFMTIPEAVGLILQAGAMGEGGEIYVLDMGEPMLIRELAEQMIRLSGLVPGEDIDIVYTGLRPGEKLYEELFHASENLRGTSHAKLHLAESRQYEWRWLESELADLANAATSRDVARLRHHLEKIVPEYGGGDGGPEPKPGLKLVGG
ncbi:MAG: nucleoside-diphosphate sugar epimerase/dehydratase [Thermodesulfobacteriota bacterium]